MFNISVKCARYSGLQRIRLIVDAYQLVAIRIVKQPQMQLHRLVTSLNLAYLTHCLNA